MTSSDAKISRYCFCCTIYMGICSSLCTMLSRPSIASANVFQMCSCQKIFNDLEGITCKEILTGQVASVLHICRKTGKQSLRKCRVYSALEEKDL